MDDSSALCVTVDRCFRHARDPDAFARKWHAINGFLLGTSCSGTDGLAFALLPCIRARLVVALAALGFTESELCAIPPRLFRSGFAVEINVVRRQFIMRAHGSELGDFRLFPDLLRLCTHDGKATDVVTGSLQSVPKARVFVSGTSCRNFSNLCNASRKVTSVQVATSSVGKASGSISTLEAALAYIKKYRPAIVVFENVLAIGCSRHDAVSVLDCTLAALRQLGYMTCFAHIDAHKLDGAQSRLRCWYGGVLVETVDTERALRFESDVSDAVRHFGLGSSDTRSAVDAYFEPDDCELVHRALLRMATGSNGGRPDAWVDQHAAYELSFVEADNSIGGHAISYSDRTDTLRSPGVACLPLREQDLVRLKALEMGDRIGWCLIPTDKSLSWCKPFDINKLPCLTQKSRLFSWRRRRCILGFEQFKVQMGVHSRADVAKHFGIGVEHEFDDEFFRKAAGDAFSLCSACAFLCAVVDSLTHDEVVSLARVQDSLLQASLQD